MVFLFALFLLMLPRTRQFTLFPYTTLFRSKEVPWQDVVRGYEVQKGKYVTITQKELERLEIRSGRLVEIFPFGPHTDRKSTRLNSSHEWISYAVFCLKKKKKKKKRKMTNNI